MKPAGETSENTKEIAACGSHIAAIGHVPHAVNVYIKLFSLIVLHKLVADVYETLLVTFNLDERYMHIYYECTFPFTSDLMQCTTAG